MSPLQCIWLLDLFLGQLPLPKCTLITWLTGLSAFSF